MGDSDNNITVEGVPLKAFLDKRFEEDSDPNIKEVMQDNQVNLYKPSRLKYKDHKEKHGKVKHLSPSDIRKDYGIMSLPYEYDVENIIYIMIEKGPIDVRGIAKELNWQKSMSSLSSKLSTLQKKFDAIDPPIVKRSQIKGTVAYEYYASDYSTKDAIAIYRENRWRKSNQIQPGESVEPVALIGAQDTEPTNYQDTTAWDRKKRAELESQNPFAWDRKEDTVSTDKIIALLESYGFKVLPKSESPVAIPEGTDRDLTESPEYGIVDKISKIVKKIAEDSLSLDINLNINVNFGSKNDPT